MIQVSSFVLWPKARAVVDFALFHERLRCAQASESRLHGYDTLRPNDGSLSLLYHATHAQDQN
jgi:hypothetical protein